MKRILAVIILLSLFAYPIVHVTRFLNSPPSSSWGYSREVTTYPDKSLKPFTPLEVLPAEEGYLAVYLANGAIDLKSISPEGEVTSSSSVAHAVKSVWNFEVGSLQKDTLELYLYGSETVTQLLIDVKKASVKGEKVMGEEIKRFTADGRSLVMSTESELIVLHEGQEVYRTPAEKVTDLRAVESEDEIAIVYTLGDGSFTNKHLTYSLADGDVHETVIENPEKRQLQAVVDFVERDGSYTALFMAKDKVGQKQRITYSVLGIDDHQTSVKGIKDEWWLITGGQLMNDSSMIMPVPTGTGLDYFGWDVEADIDWSKRMTREKTLPNKPMLFEKDGYEDLMWISIESEGKVLKLTSTREEFLIKETTKDTYATSAYVVVISSVMSSMITIVPILILGAALMALLNKLDKKDEGKNRKSKLVLYYLIFISALFGLFMTNIVSKAGDLPLMPAWMSSPVALVLLFIACVVVGGLVARLLEIAKTSIGPWPTALVSALIIAVVYNNAIALYSPMLNIFRSVM
ncbi:MULTISPECIES: hypothetical protein [unclassified Fusibacter]|uniref:hypothetical protein n=1 Tax=unclassified Fusibacter TaxID=2624464 RepID=UPI001010EA17|nr:MULTISPECIES: hypothetical protein [unclassified Fusibacter]MCK8059359.1 hypothetical protein [Fusibacter sp. A2]NPE21177.1 hypothetical protein [Fusibacter sp. A1]RXV62445.1 hypothetical protein DWB64_05025 [Fusibacter sp. A1]